MTDEEIINECHREIRRLRAVVRDLEDYAEQAKEARVVLLDQLRELQADFEDLSDDQLIDCRDCMKERVDTCLIAIKETAEDNIE